MKRIIITSLLVAMVLGIGVAFAPQAQTGNGCPSGPHYNLNIIGMKYAKSPDMECGEGHRIFVPLYGKCKILLQEGDFAVIDCDATNGPAKFHLPNPDPGNTGTTVYSVYARPLGKPNGKAKMRTGAWDPDISDYVYSVCVLELERTKGKQKFENVSKELLYIYAYIYVGPGPDMTPNTADDEYEFMRVPLFHEALEGYFWEYDNNGLKLLQLRFYEGVTTTVPGVVDSVVPDSGVQGADDLVLTITGTDIAVGSGADVTFSNDGIDIESIVKVDNNTLQVTIDIDSDAEVGEGYLLVTRIDDGVEWIGPFEVTAAP